MGFFFGPRRLNYKLANWLAYPEQEFLVLLVSLVCFLFRFFFSFQFFNISHLCIVTLQRVHCTYRTTDNNKHICLHYYCFFLYLPLFPSSVCPERFLKLFIPWCLLFLVNFFLLVLYWRLSGHQDDSKKERILELEPRQVLSDANEKLTTLTRQYIMRVCKLSPMYVIILLIQRNSSTSLSHTIHFSS